MLRLNTAERIKVVLKDALGVPVTGLVAIDFKASSVYLYKADGSKTTIALTLGVNLFEADATDGPGIYEILLTSTHTNTLGPITVSIQPALALFVATYFQDVVDGIAYTLGTPTGASVSIDIANVLLDTANILVDTNLIKLDTAATVAKLPATTISSAVDVTNAVTSVKGTDNRSITDIAGVGTFNLATDTLHDIKTAIGGFATTADVNAARDSIKGPDGRDLTQLAGAGFVSASDSHVALKAAITAISGATAAAIFEELLALHMTPNTFGEFMNILSAIMLNRVRIDKLTKTLTVFQADNITPLKTYPLYDLNGNPALLNASERGKGI